MSLSQDRLNLDLLDCLTVWAQEDMMSLSHSLSTRAIQSKPDRVNPGWICSMSQAAPEPQGL